MSSDIRLSIRVTREKLREQWLGGVQRWCAEQANAEADSSERAAEADKRAINARISGFRSVQQHLADLSDHSRGIVKAPGGMFDSSVAVLSAQSSTECESPRCLGAKAFWDPKWFDSNNSRPCPGCPDCESSTDQEAEKEPNERWLALIEALCRAADPDLESGFDHTPEGEALWDRMVAAVLAHSTISATPTPSETPPEQSPKEEL